MAEMSEVKIQALTNEDNADEAMESEESSSYWKIEPEDEIESQMNNPIPNITNENEIGVSENLITSYSEEEQKDFNEIDENDGDMEIENIYYTDDKQSQSTTTIIGDSNIDSVIETTTKAIKIKAIDRNVVHQICSGQVIVTLSTAVKELVENAIDAGATSVEIRLVESGSQVIEVIDNGYGVDEANFEGLALKHHTSKISEFEDLVSVATFGFRGEALSSLCALSDLSVITRSKACGSKMGFKIEYDSKGKVVSKAACAREFGTTVVLKNLFLPLPVRHREFMKNLKREFHKMVNTLYGYCLIADGVRITCTNQIGSGAPSKIISVPACPTMRERIAAIFGSKQVQSLMEFHQEEDISEETLEEYGLSHQTSKTGNYTISGYVSMPNRGRSSNDRQFFFINSRPCDPSKISRIVNEAYHGYSRNQSPFVCLNIKTRRENVDVNVTPDKRVLYLQSEKSLYALLKASLTSMYMSESSAFNLSAGQEILTFSQYQSQSDSQELKKSYKRKFGKPSSNEPQQFGIDNLGDDKTFANQFSSNNDGGSRNFKGSSVASAKLNARSFLQNFAHKSSLRSGDGGSNDRDNNSSQEFNNRFSQPYKRERVASKQPSLWGFVSQLPTNGASDADRNNISENSDSEKEDSEDEVQIINEDLQKNRLTTEYGGSQSQGSSSTFFSSQETLGCGDQLGDEDLRVIYDDEFETEEFDKGPNVNATLDWTEVKSKLRLKNQRERTKKNYAQKFRAKIVPGDNDSAEQELRKQLTKDMFLEMEILGQFNLGFVIVKYGPDLFIVDQHASDEKYNFEDLEKTTIMQSQKLIRPMELQLPAVSENIIMENLEVFQKNGFDFEIDFEGEPTKRVKLSTIPYSKSSEFGKSDVDELIFMMEDAPEKCFCRPSKVRLMLASRACRKSVMIGTSLSTTEMKKIVNHMGEMDQPWNCPHGRPTIRHLINMNLLPDMDLETFNH